MFSRTLTLSLALIMISVSGYAKVMPAAFDEGRNRLIAYMLSHQLPAQHFTHKSLEEISQAAFDLYLRQLDPRKRFLLREDVEQLSVFKDRIDDELRRGKVILPDRGTAIFNKRVKEVMEISNELLTGDFDPDSRDYLEFDPEKIDYAASKAELRERWRKLLKMQTLETYLSLQEEKGRKENQSADKVGQPSAANALPAGIDPDLWHKSIEDVRGKNERYLTRLLQETLQEHYNRFFDAVARAFDPHTSYMAPTSKEDFDIHMSGSLEGIGALLREDDGDIKVVRLIPGSAAERQGDLQAEDVIIAVSEEDAESVDMRDMRIREAVSYIRGPKGSKVILTVMKPDGARKNIPIIRDVVQIEETYVKSEVLTDSDGNKIGYIRLPSFYRDFAADGPARNVTDDFRHELYALKQKGIKAMILDLRDNGGGSLSDAIDISGMFIADGPIVQVKNAQGEMKVLEDTDKNIDYDGPVVVLVNKFSASASEILAAALQDYNRALIVGGEHTHGKGTVQSIVDLDRNLPLLHRKKYENLGALKVTIQKFYRVNGGSTQYKGIEPDVTVPTILDFLESGEKNLDYSLPWDSVETVPFTVWKNNPFDQQRARSLTTQWISGSAEFADISKRAEKARRRSEQTTMPVYLEGIRKDRQELADLNGENGDSGFPDIEGMDIPAEHDDEQDEKTLKEKLAEDPYVQLSVHLLDELALQR